MKIFEELGRTIQSGRVSTLQRQGEVQSVRGTLVIARLPSATVGELCRIDRRSLPPLDAEVVGFVDQSVKLMALGALEDIESGAVVVATGERIQVDCGVAVEGRVLDALGYPIDGKGPVVGPRGEAPGRVAMMRQPPNPMTRVRIREPLETGIRVIDGMLTVGVGQRVGIFAGPGVGKSRLISMIARGVDADLVVLALIGERGREVRAFVEDDLRIGEDPAGQATSEGAVEVESGARRRPPAVVVVSTSDEPALRRLKAAHTATAIAEHARAEGKRVVLMMDSVTRFARALREVGLAAEEPPGRGGFPASVFAELPRLVERAGWDERGSITGFYTVLRESEEEEDVVASEVKSLLDGHIVLSPRLAAQTHYPAVDVLKSVSRLYSEISTPEQLRSANRIRALLSTYDRAEDKILCGAYRGDDPSVNLAIELRPQVMQFFRQREHEHTRMSACHGALSDLGRQIGSDD